MQPGFSNGQRYWMSLEGNAIWIKHTGNKWYIGDSEDLGTSTVALYVSIKDPNKEGLAYDGTRALDAGSGEFRKGIVSGGKADPFRCYVTKENAANFPALKTLIATLQAKETYTHIGHLIGKDLSNAYVRLEVICDRQGFWLKPHCDIEEKLLSGLCFVNLCGESEDLGTDFYDKDLKLVKTVPYRHNYGYFFTSGPNTWHGMELKTIQKERRCIQVNYVTFPTDWPVKK